MRTVSILLTAVFAAPLASAMAAPDWHHEIERGGSLVRAIDDATPLADGGFLVRHDRRVLRFAADEALLSDEAVDHWFGLGVEDAGRGVAYFDYFQDGISSVPLSHFCAYQRTASGLAIRSFSRNLVSAPFPGQVRFLDGDGGYFAVPAFIDGSFSHRFLARFGPDCTMTRVLEYEHSFPTVVNIPTARAAYMLAAAPPGSNRVDTLHRVEEQGIVWTRRFAEEAASIQLSHLVASASGDALIAGRVDGRSFHARVRGDGSLVWASIIDMPRFTRLLQADGDGMIVVTQGSGASPPPETRIAYALDGAGALRWQVSFDPWRFHGLLPSQARTRDALYWILAEGGSPVNSAGVLARTDAHGVLDVRASFQAAESPLAELADGSILIRRREGSTRTLHRIAPGSNSAQPVAVPDAPVSLRVPVMLAHGEGVLVLVSGNDGHASLHRMDDRGEAIWSTAIAAMPDIPPDAAAAAHSWLIAASATTVCITRRVPIVIRETELFCFDAEDGALRFGPFALGQRIVRPPSMHVAADGGVIVYPTDTSCDTMLPPGSCSRPLRQVRIAADGTLLADRVLADVGTGMQPPLVVMPDGGAVALLPTATASEVVRFGAFGTPQWRLPRPESWGSTQNLAIHPNGTLLVTGDNFADPGLRLMSVSAEGQPRWFRHLDVRFLLHVPAAESPLHALENGWLLPVRDRGHAWLHAVALADGADLWPAVGPLRLTGSPRVRSEGQGPHFVLIHDHGHATRMQWFHGDDGRIVGASEEAPSYAWQNASFDAAGGVVLATQRRDEVSSRIRLARYAPDSLEPGPLDIETLAGAWFSPATTGQGLLLDVLAEEATLFGAWFTYTAIGGHQPTELRWYSLQGDIGSDANEVELAIVRNRGGNFAAPPVTAGEQVGTAWLSRPDCERLQLRYEFAPEELDGLRGAQVLRTLLGTDCAHSHGLADHAATGAWFDPATAGQGLLVDVRSGEDDASGIFFGAWFTFDVADRADDPTAQHWFTLQGTWRDGESDDLVLLRTIGGSFDAEATSNTQRVGGASFAVQDCEQATLAWRFDDGELAGPYAALEGEVFLRRLGGCG